MGGGGRKRAGIRATKEGKPVCESRDRRRKGKRGRKQGMGEGTRNGPLFVKDWACRVGRTRVERGTPQDSTIIAAADITKVSKPDNTHRDK